MRAHPIPKGAPSCESDQSAIPHRPPQESVRLCRTILTKPVTCPISTQNGANDFCFFALSASLTCLCIKAPCVCVLWSDPVRMISRLMVPVKRQHLEEGSPPFGLHGSCDQKVGGLRLGYALLYFGIGVGALYLKSTNVPLGARGRWAPKSKPAKVTHRPSWPTKAAKPGHFAFPRERVTEDLFAKRSPLRGADQVAKVGPPRARVNC